MASVPNLIRHLDVYLRNWCYTTHKDIVKKQKTTLKKIVVIWHVTKTLSDSTESVSPIKFTKTSTVYINNFEKSPIEISRCRSDLFSFATEKLEKFLSEPNLSSFKVKIETVAYDPKDVCINRATLEDDFKKD